MRLLAIDTSGPQASAATLWDGRIVCQAALQDQNTHSEKIMGLIDFVLCASRFEREELEAIAVTTGPGSFTGLRIGICLVKAMAQALSIPCIGVNTLDALCYAASGATFRCAVMDARRNEVYCAAYHGEELVIPHGVKPLSDFLSQVKALKEPAVFAGDGVRVYRDQIVHTLKEQAFFVPEPNTVQSAASTAVLAYAMDRSLYKDAYTLEANYFRLSQAEREAMQRQHGAI